MPGESSSTPRRIVARERQGKALELRKAGVTFERIATQLDYRSRQAAKSAVDAAMQRIIQEPAESLRKLDLERLDTMLFALMPAIRRGEWQSVNSGLKVMERRAKLLGLDAPVKIEAEIEHKDGRDLSRVPQKDLDQLLAQAEAIFRGDTG